MPAKALLLLGHDKHKPNLASLDHHRLDVGLLANLDLDEILASGHVAQGKVLAQGVVGVDTLVGVGLDLAPPLRRFLGTEEGDRGFGDGLAAAGPAERLGAKSANSLVRSG